MGEERRRSWLSVEHPIEQQRQVFDQRQVFEPLAADMAKAFGERA